MRTNNISPINFNEKLKFPVKPYFEKNSLLLNHVRDIMDKYHVPGTLSNDVIELTNIPRTAIKELEEKIEVKFLEEYITK